MKKGIDVSSWNGEINWEKVKSESIEFVIIRTGYGSQDSTQIDKQFYNYVNGCETVNLPMGAYHYGYATSEEEARNEANFCLSILNGIQLEYPVFYDVEEICMFECGREKLTKIINAFCEVITNAGYKAGLYISCSHAENYVNMTDILYEKWIAQYNSECQYEGDYQMWQYSSKGTVNGINSSVDMNICYKEYSQKTGNLESKDTIEWIYYGEQKKWAVKKNGKWIYNSWFWDEGEQGWYRLDENGWAVTGWFKEGEAWYRFSDNCKMITGWTWDDKEKGWYYLDSEGRLVKGGWVWDEREKAWYYLKPDFTGKMAAKEYVKTPGEMTLYWVDENGKWVK